MSEWSKIVPTAEGWYWWRDSGDTESLVPLEIPAKAPSDIFDHLGGEWCRIPSLAEVAKLREELAAAKKDAERWAYWKPRMIAADFEWGEHNEPVLVFRLDCKISADLDQSTDAAFIVKG